MRLAFTAWGLAPAAFWSMTPRELASALGRPASRGLDRAALDELMRRFPDRPSD
ncbi:MAG: phage tail assembly chaperone [Siculibacillus sp.]